MAYDPSIPKERLVVAVGRWDDAKVKGTRLLAETIEVTALADKAVRFEIYGRAGKILEAWHKSLPDTIARRVMLAGVLPNDQVRKALQRASVSLCTSLRESYHAVSAEALCCGTSVVGPNVPEIPSMKWFTGAGCGTLAARTPSGLGRALREEIDARGVGKRDPVRISTVWTSLFHASRVAGTIIHLAEDVTAQD